MWELGRGRLVRVRPQLNQNSHRPRSDMTITSELSDFVTLYWANVVICQITFLQESVEPTFGFNVSFQVKILKSYVLCILVENVTDF